MTNKIRCYECQKIIAIYLGEFTDDWKAKTQDDYLKWIRCLECYCNGKNDP